MTTMLYKCPGPHDIHGGNFDYIIVDDDQIDDALEDGWHLTTPEAKQARDDALASEASAIQALLENDAAKLLSDASTPPTRQEMEQMADRLGIPYSTRTSDKKLRALIEADVQPDDAQATA